MESFKFDSKVVGFKLSDSKEKVVTNEIVTPTGVSLPKDAPARMKTLIAEGKKWYLTVVLSEDSKNPFAMFCQTNSKEDSVQTSDAMMRLESLAYKKGILPAHIDATIDKISKDSNVTKLTRMISLNLRHGVLPISIVTEINKMEDIFVGSFLFQIKKFLSQYIEEGEEVKGEVCSSCGSAKLVYESGCISCLDCGGSKCS